jgi:hypothetical protein
VSSQRQAVERAVVTLAAAVRALPLAGGGTVGEVAAADPVAEARLLAVLAGARVLVADYASDGGTHVTVALPLEAVRGALAPPAAPEAAAQAPTAILVDARKTRLRPVLGVRLVAGATQAALPTVWSADPGAAAADARLGPRVVKTEATEVGKGAVSVTLDEAELGKAARGGALVMIVVGGHK